MVSPTFHGLIEFEVAKTESKAAKEIGKSLMTFLRLIMTLISMKRVNVASTWKGGLQKKKEPILCSIGSPKLTQLKLIRDWSDERST